MANQDDEPMDPHLMSGKMLKRAFKDKAPEAQTVLFQHTTRMTGYAEFLRHESKVMVKPEGRQRSQCYRKGQVHSSVFLKALQSSLASSNVPLGPSEACVIATGGTPEAIVGAIAAGFQHVIYIASDDTEQMMMQLPLEFEEREHDISYFGPSFAKFFVHRSRHAHTPTPKQTNISRSMLTQLCRYTSPDVLNPMKGVLAAAGVRDLKVYIENWVCKHPGDKVGGGHSQFFFLGLSQTFLPTGPQ